MRIWPPCPATPPSTSGDFTSRTPTMPTIRSCSPFTRGDPENQHLKQEYLAVLETSHHTPYFLNLHHRDVAHTVILGRTGSGKSFPAELSDHQPAEVRTAHFHLRSGRQLWQPHPPLRGLYLRVDLNPPTSRSIPLRCRRPSAISIFSAFSFGFWLNPRPRAPSPAGRNGNSTSRLRTSTNSTTSSPYAEYAWQHLAP